MKNKWKRKRDQRPPESNRQLTHRTTAKYPAEHWGWPGASLSNQRLLM